MQQYAVQWPQLFDSTVEELKQAVGRVTSKDINLIVKAVLKCKAEGGRIFFAASGRSLNVLLAFGCRLAQKPIELTTHALCGSTFPPVKGEDLLLVCSGTGYTQYAIDFVRNWKIINKNMILLTSNDGSENPLWRLMKKRIFVGGITQKYKEMRKVRRTQDKYDVSEDFSETFVRDKVPSHLIFEIATLVLLEIVVHELVSILQLGK